MTRPSSTGLNRCPSWMTWTLRAAAIDNVSWGIFILAMPHLWWDWIGQPRPNPEFLWTGLGLLILLFGVGYWIASYDPAKHWGLVAIGLASKVMGFLGTAVGCFAQKNVPVEFFWSGISNDLVWWIPFAFILRWGLSTLQKRQSADLGRPADRVRVDQGRV